MEKRKHTEKQLLVGADRPVQRDRICFSVGSGWNKYPRYCMILLLIDRLSRRFSRRAPSSFDRDRNEGRGERISPPFAIPQMCNLNDESISVGLDARRCIQHVYTSSVGGVTWKTALKEDRCVYVCVCMLQVCEQVAAR